MNESERNFKLLQKGNSLRHVVKVGKKVDFDGFYSPSRFSQKRKLPRVMHYDVKDLGFLIRIDLQSKNIPQVYLD